MSSADSPPPPITTQSSNTSADLPPNPTAGAKKPRSRRPKSVHVGEADHAPSPDSEVSENKKTASSAARKPKKALAREDKPPAAPMLITPEEAVQLSASISNTQGREKKKKGPKASTPKPVSESTSTTATETSPSTLPPQTSIKRAPKKQTPRTLADQTNATAGPSQKTQKAHSSSGVFCTICSQEDSKFWSMGSCNHSICSNCSLRLRCKSKDKQCPICKLVLEAVIIFSTDVCDLNTQTFNAFPMVQSQGTVLDLLECVHPDVQVDQEHQMLYYKCASHYKEMDMKKSLHCPLPQCRLRCSSVPQLCQHVTTQHHGQVLCKLCVENRPLFSSELQVFSKKDLKEHMKGSLTMDSNARNAAYAYHTGHPLCQFCQEHVFDKHALYLHMQKKHFTCHLCDSSMMFRYYSDLSSLRQHHQQDHYVCSLCHHNEAMRHSDISYAFRNIQEFSVHMKDMHAVRDFAKYVLGGHSVHRSNAAGNRGGAHLGMESTLSQHFFDLDLGNANPAPVQQARQRSQQLHHGAAVSANDDILQLIPANMRIAGRVTGTGTFSNEDRDLIALQQAVDTALANRPAGGRNSHSYAGRLNANAVRSTMEFPSLPPSQETSAKPKASISSGDESPHPMSLVGKVVSKKESSDYAKKAAEEGEEKKITRQMQLASAFGMSSNDQKEAAVLTSEELGVSVSNPAYRKHVSNALTGLTITPISALFNTLYPVELLAWARKNRAELIKIERRIVTFFETPKDSSLHLKPMPYVDRQMIHCLAKFYHCQSVEYDYEPKRYVSLIKTIDSKFPSTTLSNAIAYNSFLSASNNLFAASRGQSTRGPVIYFVLNEGLLLHWGRPFERNKTQQTSQSTGLVLLPFHSKHIIFGEVVMQIRALCREYEMFLEDSVESIAWAGSNAIALQCIMRYFDNGEVDSELALYHAIQLAKFFIQISSMINNVATASSVQGDAEFLRFYRVVTDFVMPDDKATSATNQNQVDADGFVVVSANHRKPLPGIDYEEEVTFSRKKEEDAEEDTREDHWTVAEEAHDAKAAAPVAVGVYQPPRPSTTATEMTSKDKVVGDDWESVDVVDEWAEFLAERKARVATGTVEPYRPKKPSFQAPQQVVSQPTPVIQAPDDWEGEEQNESTKAVLGDASDDDNWRKGLKIVSDTENAEDEDKKEEITNVPAKKSKAEKVPVKKVANRFTLLSDDEDSEDEVVNEEESS